MKQHLIKFPKIHLVLWLISTCLYFCALQLHAQSDSDWNPDEFHIRELEDIRYSGEWKYSPGHDPQWADPSFDDSDWETAIPTDIGRGQPESGWQGSGWFRRHFQVDSTLLGKTIALVVQHVGAMELYIDGELFYHSGTVGMSAAEETRSGRWVQPPFAVTFSQPNHVIAVHFSNHVMDMTDAFEGSSDGFIIEFADFQNTNNLVLSLIRRSVKFQMFYTALPLAFCFLHFLLFLFYPQNKSNLYFALFALNMALLTFFVFRSVGQNTAEAYINNLYIFKLSLIGISIFGFLFLYSLLHAKLPTKFWIYLGIGIVLAFISRGISHRYAYIYAFLALMEQLRTIIIAIHKKHEGIWIIGIGYFILTVGCSYQMGSDFHILPRITAIGFAYLWGFLGMLISISIFLARQFALANSKLTLQIAQIKELSARSIEQERLAKEQETTRIRLEEENKRKEIELEEAKKRQKVMNELEQTNKELAEAYTTLQETHAHLMQSEKMASLGILVAGVAHEINTPVGAMSSMHNTLVRAFDKLKDKLHQVCPKASEEEKDAERLFKVIDDSNKVIASGAERVTNIVRRLKSFARLDEAELMKVDIHEGIEDTLTIVHHELKHKAEVVRNFGDIPPVACFPSRLNQVYVNMLINSVQAIKDKGTITITTFLKDDKVHIKIADTGAGIPKESLSKIFDPGFTTKGVGVGTGLGLSICYQIINDHHGEIQVESEVGVGTTFTIIFPNNLDEILET